MKQLHHKVNIVPIIAKADVLTKSEVILLKKRWFISFLRFYILFYNIKLFFFLQVLEEIKLNGIKIYSLPEVDEDEEEAYKEEVSIFCI